MFIANGLATFGFFVESLWLAGFATIIATFAFLLARYPTSRARTVARFVSLLALASGAAALYPLARFAFGYPETFAQGAFWLMIPAAVIALCATAIALVAAWRPRDPVTGTWGAEGLPFLELTFDGRTGVSGTAIWRPNRATEHRAAIETGTFDKRTGGLRLSGVATSPQDKQVQYLIEGTIANDVVSGTYEIGGHKGDFTFTRS